MSLYSRKYASPITLLFMLVLSMIMVATLANAALPTSDIRKSAAQQLEQAQKIVENAQKKLEGNLHSMNDAGIIEIRDALQQAKTRAV